MRHGGRILADQLAIQGVERVFSVPGESFLAALDGLLDAGIPNTVCRHEGGAAMMAEAWGKMTGRPGVAFVTRGPGATNAAAGVHVARQDGTPMILFVGQIARGHVDRDAFQEVDFRAMFAPLAKWAAQVEDTGRLPEYVARAFATAMSGRPGPVVLALPEDMLSARADVPDRSPVVVPRPALPDLGAILGPLSRAARPLVVAGGPGWEAASSRALAAWAERHGLPVAVSFRRQDAIDNRAPAYAGDLNVGPNPALVARLRDADVVLALGTRLGDIETGGYAALDPAGAGPTLIHVHPDAAELGRVWPTAHPVVADAPAVAEALAASDAALPGWHDQMEEARAAYEAWRQPRTTPGMVKLEEVVLHLDRALPEDAIVTNGAGNYAAFLHRYYRWKGPGTQLAPTSGSMGYGLPAAVAASLRHPDRTVVCLAGDGCLQMTSAEMATAVQAGAAPVVIVCDNGRYGTIRMHQERSYPGRVSGTDLVNPDFAALARAHGGVGLTVENGAAFPDALAEARAAGRLALIHLRLDPAMLSTGADLA